MKPIAFMRLRVTNRPEDLLDIYKPSELVVQQKYDGHKVMATSSKRGVIKLYSRRGVDITKRVPTIIEALGELLGPGDTVLGEMVYTERGQQSLEKVQSILHSSKPGLAAAKLKRMPGKLTFYVYDLLEYEGYDLSEKPLDYRQAILVTLIPRRGTVRTVKDYTWGQRKKAISDSLKEGGEGAVIKVRTSLYKYRKRGLSEPWGMWWKYKVARQETTDVILTKKYDKGKAKLIFTAYQIDPKGKRIEVGRLSGLDKKTEREVKKLVDSGKETVAEVSYQGRRPSGKLRDMGWIRLRPDKPVRSVTMDFIAQRARKKNATMTRPMANPRKKAGKSQKKSPREIQEYMRARKENENWGLQIFSGATWKGFPPDRIGKTEVLPDGSMLKPNVALWTSTETSPWRSDWMRWQEAEMPSRSRGNIVRLRVRPDAKVLHIRGLRDVQKMAKEGFVHKGVMLYVDWNAISKKYDGVHVAKSVAAEIDLDVLEREPWRKLFMGWDAESTAWFRPERALVFVEGRKRSANPAKKKASKKKAVKKAPRIKIPKAWNMYVIYEEPDRLFIHSFGSNTSVSPGAAAYERSLLLKASKGKDWEVEKQSVRVLTEKELRKFLRGESRQLVPGKEQRLPNPRRSLVKEALEAEATRHRKFEEFAERYWHNCARGIYWIATNEREYIIGEPERRQMNAGKFFVACNPELALNGKNADKKYVVELNVNYVPVNSFRVKRGSEGTEIKIIDNIGKVQVMRTLTTKKAKAAFRYQQGILPSSKEQLRKFWTAAWKKLKDKKAKEAEKIKKKKEREKARAYRMARDEERTKQRRAREKEKLRKEAKKAREAKGKKAAAEREKKKRERERAKKRAEKERAARRGNPGRSNGKSPVRMVSSTSNKPGR